MLDIYLLRHGQVAASRPWRFLGQGDAALTEEGRTQMKEWRSVLRERGPGAIVHSDLARARESAAIIAGALPGVPVEMEADFREIDLGAWEGLTVAEVEAKFPGAYRARGQDMGGYAPPGGESFSTLQRRALDGLRRLVDRFAPLEKPVLVVTHIGVCRVLVAHVLQIPLPAIFYLEQRFARAHHIRFDNGRFSVAGLNLPAKAIGLAE